MPHRSLAEYLLSFYRHGAETAYAQRQGYRVVRWTYRAIAEGASQFARELEAREIRVGDRVLLWGANSAEWAVAFWGCVLRGAVVVPMDHAAATDFTRRVSRQVDARLLVRSRDREPLNSALPAMALEDLARTIAHHSRAPYASPPLNRDAILQIIFTSGTTAEPKGVVISHGNVLANLEPLEAEIRKYVKYERIFHPLRFLNLLPVSHVFGQFLGIFVPPVLRATVIFLDTWSPSEVIRTIRRERVSVLVTVPRVLDALRGKIERDAEAAGRALWFQRQLRAAENEHFTRRWWRFRELHSQFGWKFWAMLSGGAALSPETEAFWRGLGLAVIQGYGLTETTSLVSVNHPFRLGRGSIGKVLPGREIKLDASGEILVRGENISAGYWEGKEMTPMRVAGQLAEKEGWFRTGDIGELDADGNLYFKGRKKNVIVTPAGMNVYPEDLEAPLRSQAEVLDCVVIGLERDGNAEPCAVLILRHAAGDAGAVVKRANDGLAEYQHMRRWFIWPDQDFPRTPTGKPRLNVIAAAVEAHTAAPDNAKMEGSGLVNLITRIAPRAPAGLSPTAALEADLGLSSLDRVELMNSIEDRYQMDVNESNFAAATTVGELEGLLRGASPRAATARSDDYYPRWAQRWPITWIRLAVYYLLAWPATLLLGYPLVSGRAHLRGLRRPALLISNHVTSIDVAFILAALPAPWRHRLAVAMGGERLQAMREPPAEMFFLLRGLNRVGYALVVALFNVFPLPRESGVRESFRFAGELVDRGYSVLVFPEGRLTGDGNLLPFRAGIGLLAKNLNIPVVPARIDGLFPLKQAGKRIARPGQIKVAFGAPVEFAADADPEQITRELEARVGALGS